LEDELVELILLEIGEIPTFPSKAD